MKILSLRDWVKKANKRREEKLPIIVWLLGIIVGIIVAHCTVLFLFLIEYTELLSKNFFTIEIFNKEIQLAPFIGGGIISLIYFVAKKYKLISNERIENVAHVIEANIVKNGQLSFKSSIIAFLINFISLGVGASAGREGPAVHFGASIASLLGKIAKLKNREKRIILACGVAAAVSASFNAPLTGTIFAIEVIIGTFAISYFAPVSIASINAAIIIRLYLGNHPAFHAPSYAPPFMHDFILASFLGLFCGIIGGILLAIYKKLISLERYWHRKWKIPYYIMPIFAGFILSAIGIYFPQALGIGYETTNAALLANYSILFLLTLIIVKTLATTITLASGFGGGIMGASLVIGALFGSFFGQALNQFTPHLFNGQISITDAGFYAMIGMTALSGAVISAPLSATLLAFELTGDYVIAVTAMLAVGISTNIVTIITGLSFFHWQSARRGIDISAGPVNIINKIITVNDAMIKHEEGKKLMKLDKFLLPNQPLRLALNVLSNANKSNLPVINNPQARIIIGFLSVQRALDHYNDALLRNHKETHE